MATDVEAELARVDMQYSDDVDELLAEPADNARPGAEVLGGVLGAVDSVLGTSSSKYFTNRGEVDEKRKRKFIRRDPRIQRQKAVIIQTKIGEFFSSLPASLQAVSEAQEYIQGTTLRNWAEQGAWKLLERSGFDYSSWDANGVHDLKDCLDGLQSIEESIMEYVDVVETLRETEANITRQLTSPLRPKLSPQSSPYTATESLMPGFVVAEPISESSGESDSDSSAESVSDSGSDWSADSGSSSSGSSGSSGEEV